MPSTPFDRAARWREWCAEALAGLQAWCLHHPKATLREMEAEIDVLRGDSHGPHDHVVPRRRTKLH